MINGSHERGRALTRTSKMQGLPPIRKKFMNSYATSSNTLSHLVLEINGNMNLDTVLFYIYCFISITVIAKMKTLINHLGATKFCC